MMREIKFRAWNKDAKIMAYDEEDGSFYWDGVDCSRVSMVNYCLRHEGYEWMQFTDLLDKDGKEIYEGDIILGDLFDCRVPTMGTIEYDNKHACFANKNDAGLTPLPRINKIKVIGNIYEDGNLLDGQNTDTDTRRTPRE